NFIYKAAGKLKADGVNILAITSWSLLGSFGWDKLLTEPYGNYEAGAFDIRSGVARPTAIAKMVKHLANGNIFDHPVLCGGGWWERESRIIYGKRSKKEYRKFNCAPILVLGKTGTLGNAFSKLCEERDLYYEVLSRSDLNVIDIQQITQVVKKKRPWAIINT